MQPEVSHDYLGAYLSGFSDGEACFTLYLATSRRHARPIPSATFAIRLRHDDRAILETAQRFWGCGGIWVSRRDVAGKNPEAHFKVATVSDLHGIIVPHFERFPLLAKKRQDYELWKQGVALIYQVQQRPKVCRGSGCGSLPKWTDQERERFGSLVTDLQRQKAFRR